MVPGFSLKYGQLSISILTFYQSPQSKKKYTNWGHHSTGSLGDKIKCFTIFKKTFIYNAFRTYETMCPRGGIGRHKGLKTRNTNIGNLPVNSPEYQNSSVF